MEKAIQNLINEYFLEIEVLSKKSQRDFNNKFQDVEYIKCIEQKHLLLRVIDDLTTILNLDTSKSGFQVNDETIASEDYYRQFEEDQDEDLY